MKWILTINASLDLGDLTARLAALGVVVSADNPIPLGDKDLAVVVEGTADRSLDMAKIDGIKKVSPVSPLSAF